VFIRENDGVWRQQDFIRAFNAGDNDQFGFSISLSSDTLAVGAVGKSIDAGAVYVFTRDNVGDWRQQDFIRAFNAEAGDLFGGAVALAVTPLRSVRSAKIVRSIMISLLVRSMCLSVTMRGSGASRTSSGPLMPRTMTNSGFRYHRCGLCVSVAMRMCPVPGYGYLLCKMKLRPSVRL
jgi:hypothetical protein